MANGFSSKIILIETDTHSISTFYINLTDEIRTPYVLEYDMSFCDQFFYKRRGALYTGHFFGDWLDFIQVSLSGGEG